MPAPARAAVESSHADFLRADRALAAFLQSTTDQTVIFLTMEYAVYDWTPLGLFTGSRVSEYAQTRLKAGIRYNVIPDTPDAGIWAGQPLAFVWADFTFYTDHHQLVPLSDIVASHRKHRIVAVHIRFRFDKSPTNFSVRKFHTTKDPILDPQLQSAAYTELTCSASQTGSLLGGTSQSALALVFSATTMYLRS
jgi:hypothetical protein